MPDCRERDAKLAPDFAGTGKAIEAGDRVDLCKISPGQNRARARVGGRFRDQLAGVPGRPVDEDGSVQAAEEVRPSFE